MATIAIASNIAKEAEGASIVDSNRTCFNRRSREDEYGDGMPQSEGWVHSMQPICHGCRLGK